MRIIANTLLILFLVVGMSGNSQAQVDAGAGDQGLKAMVEALNEDIAELEFLSDALVNTGDLERELLAYRRDERGFHILADIDTLIAELAELPDGSAQKDGVKAQLAVLCESIGDTIFSRLEEIDQRIIDLHAQIDSLSGGGIVAAKAHIQSLESIRIKYYESLVTYLEDREFLGLPNDALLNRLRPIIHLFAETLAGQIEVSGAARSEIQGRASRDPDNADINAAMIEFDHRHKVNLTRLETIIAVLDSLGMDSSKYQEVMLQQSGAVAIKLSSPKAIIEVLKDSWSTFRAAMEENAVELFFKFVLFIIIVYMFKLLARLAKHLVRAGTERSSLDMSELLKDILVSLTGGTVMVIGVFVALSQVGLSLGPMFAGLGIAGFIIGFALQDTLGNFAAGAMILIYRPFDLDDNIEVTGASGLVKKMNLVSTTITTFDNQTLVIPNSKIWGDVIKNITAQTERRIDLEIGIGYEEDIAHAERVFNEIVEAHPKVLKHPKPNIRVHTLGDSSVNMIVRPWVKTVDYWDTYWDLMRAIKVGLDREGISIPFPQRDVHFFPQEPEADIKETADDA